jgi:hypothetical protein
MNYLASLFVPAALGLFAGIGHGVVSHYANLPVSLSDQLLQPNVQTLAD